MPMQPSLEEVSAERRRANMDASKLEADILQVVIRHAQENHTPTELILLALSNCTNHWINRAVNVKITKLLYEEMNNELLSSDAVRRVYGET